MKTTMNIEIGERIKKWRKLRKLTQKDLADKIKKNIKSIQRYETGINPVQIDVLNSIANALNVELDTLLPKESILPKYAYIVHYIDSADDICTWGAFTDKEKAEETKLLAEKMNTKRAWINVTHLID